MEPQIMIIIEELQQLIRQTQSIEALFLQQIVALEKITNYTHKSTKKVINAQKKEKVVEKDQVPEINVEQKINELMNHIQNKQKSIQNHSKPIVQVKLTEPAIEKKPPLPVANKVVKNIKNSVPMYVPPRNQNQITAKVTQTVLRTSATKIFKPQKITVKKSESKQKDIKGSSQKILKPEIKIVQKVQNKETKSSEKQIIKNVPYKSQIKSQTKPVPSEDKKKQVQPLKKIQKIVNFHKPFDQILQSLIGNNQANHKPQLKKLLLQYQGEQKGYKMHEETNRNNFIRKVNNYALSKHKVNNFTTHQIIRKRWNYHHELFVYEQLLHNLDKEITNLQQLKDCRIDPKQQYRLKKSLQTYSNRLDQIIQASKQVPNKIDLSFQYTPIKTQNNQLTPQTTFQSIHEIQVHEQLLKLLQEVVEKGSLQKKQMRCLQVLSQIAVFKSKRCPNIIMKRDYDKWKDFYQV